jgi:hypothetical protein
MAQRRPALLTFVAVVAIVIGVTNAFTALSNVLIKSVPFAQTAALPAGSAAGPSAPIIAAQLEFQRRVAEVKQRHHGLFLMALPFSLVAAGMLILGGARTFSLRRGARPLLLAGMAAGLVVGLLSVKPQLAVQAEIAEATSAMMKTMFDAMNAAAVRPGPARTMVGTMATVGKASAMTGLAASVLIAVAKIGFLVFGLAYLTRARIRAVFAAPAAPGLAEPTEDLVKH